MSKDKDNNTNQYIFFKEEFSIHSYGGFLDKNLHYNSQVVDSIISKLSKYLIQKNKPIITKSIKNNLHITIKNIKEAILNGTPKYKNGNIAPSSQEIFFNVSRLEELLSTKDIWAEA